MSNRGRNERQIEIEMDGKSSLKPMLNQVPKAAEAAEAPAMAAAATKIV